MIKARELLKKYGRHTKRCRNEYYPEAWYCICVFEQALVELQAEPEHTDWPHKEWPHQVHLRAKTAEELQEKIVCLFPKAEPSEFMKEARELARGYGGEWGKITITNMPPPLLVVANKLNEACDLIDRQQAELEKKEE